MKKTNWMEAGIVVAAGSARGQLCSVVDGNDSLLGSELHRPHDLHVPERSQDRDISAHSDYGLAGGAQGPKDSIVWLLAGRVER